MYNEMNCELTHDYVGEDQKAYEQRHDIVTAGLIAIGLGLIILAGVLFLLTAFCWLAELAEISSILMLIWA